MIVWAGSLKPAVSLMLYKADWLAPYKNILKDWHFLCLLLLKDIKIILIVPLWFIVNLYHQCTYCEKTPVGMAYCEKATVSGSIITTEQMFLYSGVCNLVLETGPDANVLTVINEKLTFVTNVKYTKEMLIRLIFRKTYPSSY